MQSQKLRGRSPRLAAHHQNGIIEVAELELELPICVCAMQHLHTSQLCCSQLAAFSAQVAAKVLEEGK